MNNSLRVEIVERLETTLADGCNLFLAQTRERERERIYNSMQVKMDCYIFINSYSQEKGLILIGLESSQKRRVRNSLFRKQSHYHLAYLVFCIMAVRAPPLTYSMTTHSSSPTR